jgi:hypothetical protein
MQQSPPPQIAIEAPGQPAPEDRDGHRALDLPVSPRRSDGREEQHGEAAPDGAERELAPVPLVVPDDEVDERVRTPRQSAPARKTNTPADQERRDWGSVTDASCGTGSVSRRQRPVNSGDRFSMKAVTASRWSDVFPSSDCSRASSASVSSSESVAAVASTVFTAR